MCGDIGELYKINVSAHKRTMARNLIQKRHGNYRELLFTT